MLPGLGISEIVVLAVLALLVVGPKDLPLMLRKLGQFTRKLQALAHEFRAGFDELARQAELDELRKEVDALRRANPINVIRDEVAGIERDLTTYDPTAPAPEPAAATDAQVAEAEQLALELPPQAADAHEAQPQQPATTEPAVARS